MFNLSIDQERSPDIRSIPNARQVTISALLETWAAEESINTVRVMLCSTAQGFCEHQLTANCLALEHST